MIENAVGIPVIGTVPYEPNSTKKNPNANRTFDTTSEVVVEKVKRATRTSEKESLKVVSKRGRTRK